MKRFEMFCGLVLGGVFMYAGAAKWKAPWSFADSMVSFKILPLMPINPLVLTLPPLEVLAGLLLVGAACGETAAVRCLIRRVAALSVMVMTSAFLIALFSALTRGISVDCGCFGGLPVWQTGGKLSTLKTWLAVGRDMIFFAMAIAIYRGNKDG
ncbi:MAG: DoxX family protein [Verrucomicrobia bacterium]|nr:DoxX family protein [Verrucomicrobiota bacterium]